MRTSLTKLCWWCPPQSGAAVTQSQNLRVGARAHALSRPVRPVRHARCLYHSVPAGDPRGNLITPSRVKSVFSSESGSSGFLQFRTKIKRGKNGRTMQSGNTGLKVPNNYKNTGTRPKVKGQKLASSSPKKISQVSSDSVESSPKKLRSSPKRIPSLEDPSSLHQVAMGFSCKAQTNYHDDLKDISFLEFETKYTLEKELLLSKYELRNEYDGCSGLTPTRMGVYTELPDPCSRNYDTLVNSSCLQPAAEGFSFAPGWALNAEHFYQWQQRGKTTKEVDWIRWLEYACEIESGSSKNSWHGEWSVAKGSALHCR